MRWAAGSSLGRRRAVSLIVYLGAVVGSVGLTLALLFGTWDSHAAMVEAEDLRDALQARSSAVASRGGGAPTAMASPFLDGPTLGVAGAALQQRFDDAVSLVGGAVLSSQVELPVGDAAGDLKLTAECNLPEPALGRLLHAIETATPFLFVERLTVQAPDAISAGGPLRVQIGIAARWQSGAG